ncbi:MAG: CBS domain-containing protein [Bacteroidales bacterium]|nr:CBS domain-containing protein [Bacteroidales bacterium]MBN2763655.1 CBS domain-containing protein [Bacteroidales bacterium]
MLAKDLISDVVPALRTSDNGQKALYWMDIFRISHLPIVNNEDFLGLISDKDIYDYNMADEPIGNHSLSLFSPFVTYDQHLYEVIELASRLNLTVVPVLDHNNHYLGVITLNDLLHYFADFSALKEPGAIIVLDMNINDYSLSQIAQIVESNDAKILSVCVSSHSSSTKLEVTLKINRTDLSSIVQTFNRYNYIIKSTFLDEEDMNSFYENRYEMFMKYLSI